MGDHAVNISITKEQRAKFIEHLLTDVQALEMMLAQNLFEKDIVRIGAEQEFCLVDKHWRPSLQSESILADIADPHFTTELARYNLEINLDPLELSKDCFSKMQATLTALLQKATTSAKKRQTKILLTGILPTITKDELSFKYISPNPRYSALNTIVKELRGSDFELHIKGVDELTIKHDSVLFEACNTSFQLHLQVAPDDFISSYNWAQAIAGPVLGICTNSPLLLGRELWSETRIALFQQSIDIRGYTHALKDQQARVTFSNEWAAGSVSNLFKNDIAQHKVILTKDIPISSVEALQSGVIPKLAALSLHNSTIYRWNRPCYGVSNNQPHLRIENRYIPAGPTIIDEIANFVFWAGLMKGRPATFDSLNTKMDFRDVKSNFIKAARNGKDSMMLWMGEQYTVQDLILNELLPIAHIGLEKLNIRKEDCVKYLGIIEERAKGKTGSSWTIENYRKLREETKQDEALILLTKNIYQLQENGEPVHKWPNVKSQERIQKTTKLLGHIMTTKLFTVNENDLATLATSIMEWKNIHHVPVENNGGQLTGLLTWTRMKRFKEKVEDHQQLSDATVAEIMETKVITGSPDMSIKKAITLMKENEIGCLPVLQNQHLVGIVTIEDVIEFDNGKSL